MTLCIHDHGAWGPPERVGAAHRLTAEVTRAALALAREGRVIDLGRETETDAPRIAPNQTPYVINTSASWRNTMKARRAQGAENEVGANLERVGMTMHVGTHIDALGHFTIGDRMYGERDAHDVVGDRGLNALAAEDVPPIVTRALAMDLAGLDGGAHLEAGRAIRAEDLEAWCAQTGLEPRDGDVVLIRTGWGRFFMADNARYLAGEPGIDPGAARWLTGRGVVAIGADNMAIEVLPGVNHPKEMMPVHQHCLVEAGVYLIENMDLDPLAEAGLREVCLVAAAPKFKGATGSPLRPLALV